MSTEVISDLGLGVEHHVATRHGRAGGLAVVVQVTVLQVGYNLHRLCQTFWVEFCRNGGLGSGEGEY